MKPGMTHMTLTFRMPKRRCARIYYNVLTAGA